MPQAHVYEIRNVEGVRELRLELTEGVNVLRGRNEAGKTSAIRALTRATGGEGTLTVRDGALKGTVRGPGVLLKVGKTVRSDGDPEVELADYGAIAQLIDPGLKSRAARDKARLSALMEMLPQGVSEKDLERLAGGDEDLLAAVQRQDVPEGLLEAGDAVRKKAHLLARDWEARRDEARGVFQASSASLDGLDLEGIERPDLTVEELEMAYEAAVRRSERTRDQAAARSELEKRQAEIRESLGERPDLDSVRTELEAASARVGELQEELAAAQEAERGLRQRLAEVEVRARTWEEQQAVLARPLEGPTEAEAEDADRAVQAAEAELDAGRAYAMADQLRTSVADAKDSLEKAELRADGLRETARAVSEQLSKILAERDLPSLAVDGDRLCVVRKGGELEDYERLSLGARTRIALEVAVLANPGRTIPLDPAFWLSLQPSRQLEVGAAAAEAGIRIVTEEPSDDSSISVRHLGGASA